MRPCATPIRSFFPRDYRGYATEGSRARAPRETAIPSLRESRYSKSNLRVAMPPPPLPLQDVAEAELSRPSSRTATPPLVSRRASSYRVALPRVPPDRVPRVAKIPTSRSPNLTCWFSKRLLVRSLRARENRLNVQPGDTFSTNSTRVRVATSISFVATQQIPDRAIARDLFSKRGCAPTATITIIITSLLRNEYERR